MKSRALLAAAIAFGMIIPTNGLAQKKEMDHDVYDSWQRVSSPQMSDNGNILTYQINPGEGDGTLYVRNMTPDRKGKVSVREIAIERGYQPTLDPAGKWLACRIKPEFAKTRKEKIDKKKKEDQTKDSLAVVDLTNMTVKKYPDVESYSTGLKAMPYIAYKSTWKEKDEKGKDRSKSGLIVLTPATDKADTLSGIGDYTFSNSGEFLAVTTNKDKKDSLSQNSVVLGTYINGEIAKQVLAKDAEAYSKLTFNDQESQLAFTATVDSNKTGDKHYSMHLADFALKKSGSRKAPVVELEASSREIIPQGKTFGPHDWTLTQNSSIFFTPDGKRIFTGIAYVRPPKDTSIVDFESARVDIWNWDSPMTPPQQKKQQNNIMRKTYSAVINLDEPTKLIPLTDRYFESIRILNAGADGMAVAIDETDYYRASVWEYGDFKDVSLVNLNNGSRKEILKKHDGSLSLSPKGKYLLWFDNSDYNWYTYNIQTGEKVNLTKDCGFPFYDEENDRPMAAYSHERSPKWLDDDQAVLIIDRYDVWKFAPDGSKFENLTKGFGRKNHLRFNTLMPESVTFTSNERQSMKGRSINPKGTLYMSVLQEDDQRNGFATLNLAKPKTPEYFLDTFSFQGMAKAAKAERIAFQKGNFRHCYDLYLTDDFYKTSEQVTNTSSQIDEYRWGTAEQFEWKAYDGTPLKGLVFMPDGVKPGEKLPVMIYFYEKNATTLYDFRTPAPSRSVVNIPFFTSRGYMVFVPDIVYKVGHPGESAYNCIVAGAEALCKEYPQADKSRMAIQGQSWGGYQVAYLVTRTNMFAAAGAGAPVSNMTSAYGGIRWESGITRAGQYEHGQSRIGKSLWDEGGLELYLENSPIFNADKVETPLLIMHNDADGAVPWYQGIEYFSDLRRLDKKVWMLEYNDEAHNLVERRNCIDLSKRLQQFFDHYLKGAPMPAWMKTGVPIDRKGQYYGFENAE